MLVVAGCTTGLLLSATALSSAVAKAPSTPAAADPKPKALTVTATPVTGLVPTTSAAQATTVDVTVTAASGGRWTVDTVTGVAQMPPGIRCSAADVEVLGYTAGVSGRPQTVKGKGSVTVPVRVWLKNTSANQDACKHLSFTIAYTATTSGK